MGTETATENEVKGGFKVPKITKPILTRHFYKVITKILATTNLGQY